MNRTLKTLLLWLLIAVLPLNAVAAAMGMSCSTVHREATASQVQTEGHQAGDHAAHHDGKHDVSAQAGLVVDSDQDQPGHSTCSACSAFCVGAVAPPPAVIPADTPNASEIVLISPIPLVAGHIPENHKRPPRHLFA